MTDAMPISMSTPMIRRGLAAMVLLCAAVSGAVASEALMGAPETALLSTTTGSTELVVRFPVASGDIAVGDLRWTVPAEVLDLGDGPTALPRSHGTSLALPSRSTPQVRVIDWTWLREPAGAVDVRDQVDVGHVQVVRGVPVVSIRVRPETAGRGLLGEIRLQVLHAPDADGRDALAAAAAKSEPVRPAAGRSAVLNAGLYQALHDGHAVLRTPADKDLGDHPFLLTDHWLRLEVIETGVYELSETQMRSEGVIGQLDPTKLRLFRALPGELPRDPELASSWAEDWTGLTEVALDLQGAEDMWSPGDAMLFYAVGPDAWSDRTDPGAGRLDWSEHRYADRAVYWLTWEDFATPSPFDGPALRVAETTAPAHGVTPTTGHRRRVHLEEQNVEAYGQLHDRWAWSVSLVNDKVVFFDAPDAQADGPAFIQVELRGKESTSVANRARVWLNDDLNGSFSGEWLAYTEDDSLRVRVAGWSEAIRSGSNSLTIRRTSDSGAPSLILDSVDLLFPAALEVGEDQLPFVHWGDDVTSPGEQVDLRLARGSRALVWDVTDPVLPRLMNGTVAGDDVAFGLTRTPGTTRHFVAVPGDAALTPADRELAAPGRVRALDRDLDYILIHAPEFAAAGERLGAHRAGRIPGVASPSVAVVDADDVYDDFGGGVRDPLALRNFLKWAFAGSEGRLTQVCLVGDCSRDFRNFRNIYQDQLPTWVHERFPEHMSYYSLLPFGSDDFLVSFEDRPYVGGHDVPDIAIGRLTVRTEEEALRRVDEIIAYDTDPVPGSWRNRVVLAADDFKQPSSADDYFELSHTRQAEHLADTYVPGSIDLRKVYLVDFEKPAGVNYKPAARLRARQEWNEGLTVFHYIGHGADNTLADEQLFLTDDIYGLTNGMRRGVFMAFSCDVGIYDQTTKQSMAETWTSQAQGAAIAAIAAAQVSWVTPNNNLSNAFYAALFPGREVVADVSLGRALWEAKLWVGDHDSDFSLANSLRYLLHGDPATRLPHPPSDLALHAASSDTLGGGSREEAVLVLSDFGMSPGPGVEYDLLVQEAREDIVEMNYDDQDDFISSLAWWKPGAVTFRGSGPVDSDTLRVPFKVPLQLRYGDHGRMRLILDTPDGSRAASLDLPVAQTAIGEQLDVDGPAIDLAFEDDRFRVKPGTLLEAAVADTSGVSILGTNPLNSVQIEFDGDGRLINVSDSFAFDPGSYVRGRVAYPLPADLEQGRHQVALYASDVLGNVGSDTLSFHLVAGNAAAIDDVTVFPNPTPGPARLLFELSDPMTVTWSLYTLSGHRVARHQEAFPTAGPQILHWDGRDDEGDALANGVYLYVLRGSWPGGDGHDIVVTGQLVMMK